MKYHEIHDLLQDGETWNQSPFEARAIFIDRMAGRRYDRDELIDAWEWFVAGWNGTLET